MVRPQKKLIFPKNWRVTQHNAAGVQIDSFLITGKYQWEASDIASEKSISNSSCDEWNMVAIKP